MERYRGIIDDFEAFMDAAERPQPDDVRVNRHRTTPEELVEQLRADGIGVTRRDWCGDFLTLDTQPGKTFHHWLGRYYVQESASGVPPLALDPQHGESVLDLCAAPGSKTTQISAMMDNRGEVVANDISGNRIRGLLANIYQTGSVNVRVIQNDGRQVPEGQQFDRVLVDVPCSAEGNLREEPELREGASMDHIEELVPLQEALLEKAFRLCRPGGRVVYSTCTFAPEEDEAVVSGFADEHQLIDPDFDFPHADGVREWDGEQFHPDVTNCTRVYPHHIDSGGMFVAAFEKSA